MRQGELEALRRVSSADITELEWRDKVIFIMVGLPARGKSYISSKVINFINWQGNPARIFNVGKHRRMGADQTHRAEFFARDNAEALAMREEIAFRVLDELLDWMQSGEVAVFDATNTTIERRRRIVEVIRNRHPYANVIFLESICEDKLVLAENLFQKASCSPDFKGMDISEAMVELQGRIVEYEKVYQTIGDDEGSYVKLINLQSKVICNRISGHSAHSITSFLMSIHGGNRPVYLIRAGEGKREELDDYDPGLSRAGQRTKQALMLKLAEDHDLLGIVCYSSVLRRAVETGEEFGSMLRPRAVLNPLDSGKTRPGRGVVVEETLRELPEDSRFTYRFAGGESQRDVAARLVSFIKEMERNTGPVLVISHLSTLQVLYGYFVGCSPSMYCDLSIPPNCLIQLCPSQYGWKETRMIMGRVSRTSKDSHCEEFY